ncbi:hypothetical protein ASPZODRAFT_99177 [Penicilliopsis zonata CBS 506.65]|uniref:ubiquitinyl hydrolase 1 n=1 Tax=Penicilliopsis zonata CBS 506.65 TaxID=1073090 RepID=A0A1L9SDW8_9EURO|nr:hypothetical protein ASPZODRAFT_99177 [Penicilliopsis zonata CBS 506.65]OJJ45284.1 hypothetical protein ASPZODRAFT_99177 [Penicilliopsis zonata CBS 506.65]
MSLVNKLGRRLAKMELSYQQASSGARLAYEATFCKLRARFQDKLEEAKQHVISLWEKYKRETTKIIRPLPQRADDTELTLSLPNSRQYLNKVLDRGPHDAFSAKGRAPKRKDSHRGPVPQNQYRKAADHYYALAQQEDALAFASPSVEDSDEISCLSFANKISLYLMKVTDSYNSNPEQKSIMILTVMRLWMLMDQCAVNAYPLLADYDPGIPARILDVLQLSSAEELIELEKIQEYLRTRLQRCQIRGRTIFEDPSKGCFAERYFDNSKHSSTMAKTLQEVQDAAKDARERKHTEWQKLSAEYDDLQRQIMQSTCMWITDTFQNKHDDRNCRRCYLERTANRMRINSHEDPLPENPVHAKAVIFELRCPSAFRLYRNTTWNIIGYLGRRKLVETQAPRLHLCEYSELQPFIRSPKNTGISLASTTKSWLTTHYRTVRLPASWEDICFPNGLKLGYYDWETKLWTGRQTGSPTFAHHCEMIVQPDSPFAALHKLPRFSVDSTGPSSYEIIASQTQCPTGLNLHEFMAYQTLFSGTSRRWLSILIELGASNLNFSAEATSLLVSQLVLIAGPSHDSDFLRSTHRILRDSTFTTKLLDLVETRIKGISSSWRETNCMSMLITILLRVRSVTNGDAASSALRLLELARNVTAAWVRKLRYEIHRCTDPASAAACSRYGLWAALLCRKTFSVYSHPRSTGCGLDALAFRDYIECSVILQENMPNNITALPLSLKNALVWDMKMVFRIRHVLRDAILAFPGDFERSINASWKRLEANQDTDSASLFFSNPKPSDDANNWWIEWSTHPGKETLPQSIRFHLLEGHLLIDGQPLGKLPSKYRESMILEHLFGKQALLTYPSNLPGMTYMLAFTIKEHHVHFGVRDEQLIVQAYREDTVLELVLPDIFRGPKTWDLPATLVDNCCHWLNLRSGILEIRPRPNIWIPKRSNWALDVRNRQAYRRESLLVDPHSRLFSKIASIFQGFEHPKNLTVFQPPKNPLSVELRRLELSFSVRGRGFLHCRQLRCQIDENQDAGTWYGLRSKLVLCDARNPQQRSIIVPMGPVQYFKHGCHVAVDVVNCGNYGRYMINDVLGRVDCPAEPRLVYSKVMFHAYTSFVLPDALTGTTGTEEALRYLRSGQCQPWRPLTLGPQESLEFIARLTPRRVYYPEDMKVMQRVYWDPELTVTIQNEQYLSLVKSICEKSQRLALFSLGKHDRLDVKLAETSSHLNTRSTATSELFQRSVSMDEDSIVEDARYRTRARPRISQARQNVYEVASLVLEWKQELCSARNLAAALQTWPAIGGYGESFNKTLLSDILQVDFAVEWGSLAMLCRSFCENDKFRLMFLFGVMAFRDNAPMDIIHTLLAFAILQDLKGVVCPEWQSYTHFRYKQIPSIEYLEQLIKPFCIPYADDERSLFPGQIASKMRRQLEKAEKAHNEQVEGDCKLLAQLLHKQWPCKEPSQGTLPEGLLVHIPQALAVIQPEWLRLFQNFEFSRHIDQVQGILDRHWSDVTMILPKPASARAAPNMNRGNYSLPTLPQILLGAGDRVAEVGKQVGCAGENRVPSVITGAHKKTSSFSERPQDLQDIKELGKIIYRFTNSDSLLERKYGEDLQQSLDALKRVRRTSPKESLLSSPNEPFIMTFAAQSRVESAFEQISALLEENNVCARWLKAANLWPCITPVTLLEQLRSTSKIEVKGWIKDLIMDYALSITGLQRLLRIRDASIKNDMPHVSEEERNAGHANWDPAKHTDWLLLEIDSNILIRDIQIEVAMAMMSPASGRNSALQMNMGQGKTSCIIPMIIAELADTQRLARVVVPKALLVQTAHLLQTRLGGLLGREVSHIPFSRKTPTNSDTMKVYFQLHKDIKRSSGVIITLPEHVLSFKLSGLQRLSDKQLQTANQMIKVQSWMQRVCRDILDECDFTLSARTQLVYPSGTQATVDGHPHRWEVAETLLHAVESHLWNLHEQYPYSIDVVHRRQGGFPMVFFLRQDVEEELLTRLVGDILDGRVLLLPTSECTQMELQVIRQFISDDIIPPAALEIVDHLFSDKPAARQVLYLLRGLLVHRILLLTLKKRWNVQYGLDHRRDPIAVPYHSKGVPSDQAEWGHPDVAILLTCLAFYLGGLDCSQLQQSLEHVLKSDDPASGYDRWTHQCNDLPDSLRVWNIINVEDSVQMQELWKYLRYNMVVIDYHLNHFVFPAHAKQFRFKLQASGWDIPLFSADGEGDLTTGFSGTNDNRDMLPLTIRQDDLPGLQHTNAEVLTYLLQNRNTGYMLAADRSGRHITEIGLLEKLANKKIRILIDAGAQILEMDNYSLVQAWLKIDYECPAAVFFSHDNKPFVLYRQGSMVPLVASPFAEDLTGCLVYLDEAHTRGTDLKLPSNACGALTLGLGQTKDHTVQAAMRLRQLGTTQSVTWVAPPEVHQSILDLQGKGQDARLSSFDVICWLLKQTCRGIEQLQPLYFSQGLDFCRRTEVGLTNNDFLNNEGQRKAYLTILRCSEQQTLEELYGPKNSAKSTPGQKLATSQLKEYMKELQTRRREFQDFGNAVHGSVLQEVEQEREVAFEVEAIRQVQKPVHYTALRFPGIDDGLLQFAKTGRLTPDGNGLEPAYTALSETDVGQEMKINKAFFAGSKLFVSKQFRRTVDLPLGRLNDNMLRPVNWLLWSPVTKVAVILIPEEVEALLSILNESRDTAAPTHLLTYSAPATRGMLPFNSLKYYAIPPLPASWKAPTWLAIELGILAGRLYFSFSEYANICNYLRIETREETGRKDGDVMMLSDDEEGFEGGSPKKKGTFTAKPLSFLQKWLSVRRKGQDFVHTPMGYVCQGKLLTESHPFFGGAVQREESGGRGRGYRNTPMEIKEIEEQEEHMGSDYEMD